MFAGMRSAGRICGLLAFSLVPSVSHGAEGKLIQGTVVDLQGKPVPKAKLWYTYAYKRGERLEVSAQADVEGQFTMQVPPTPLKARPAEYSDVWAYSPKHSLGFATPMRTEGGDVTYQVRLELSAATDTSLVVLDPDGKPVDSATVAPVNYKTRRGFDLVPVGAKPFVGGKTDSEGRVNLHALARERFYNAQVTTKEYGDQLQRFEFEGDQPAERTVRLRAVGKIEGRVVAEHLRWCGNIELHFTTELPFQPGELRRPPWPIEGKASATTDKTGRFEIPIIAEGRLGMVETVVDEDVPARLNLTPRTVEVTAGETTTLEFPMQRLVKIRSSIIAKDTKLPLEGIKIHIYYGTQRQGTDVVSDENGEFSALVMPGNVRFQPINLSSTKYLQLGSPESREVPEDAEDLKLPPIEASPSKVLAGRLIDQDDQPVADAQIIGIYRNWVCARATSNNDGSFTFQRMPTEIDPDEATYRVTISVGNTRDRYDGEVELKEGKTMTIRIKR